MAEEKYVAYVGTYTNGSSKGIHIYDVDVEEGLLYLRKVVPVNNSSYIKESRNGEYLYSIADEGVEVYKIAPNGDLTSINQIDIDGMRGCHLSTDLTGKYLFVAGYHDGKVTVIHTHHDGRLGSLMDGKYHRGQGALVERCFRPHVTCVRITPDNRFLCAVDEALDQVVIYSLDDKFSKLKEIDILRMGKEAGPKSIHFSKDGRFCYILCQITNVIRVYDYHVNERGLPCFELKQEVSTLSNAKDIHDAASAMRLSYDGKYVICATAGDDSVAMYEINPEDGTLDRMFALPTSGEYPKDIALFPDQQHIAVVNNAGGSITTFKIDYEKKVLMMKGKPHKIDTPNCMLFHKIEEAPAEFRHISEKEAEAEVQKRVRTYAPLN